MNPKKELLWSLWVCIYYSLTTILSKAREIRSDALHGLLYGLR